MEKNIIIEIRDGIIQGVFCPDETYIVNVLDHNDRKIPDKSLQAYYDDLEKEIKNLKNCY
jgi:CRISPR/Cas system-associated protein Csx1